jgi:hypothetical protein
MNRFDATDTLLRNGSKKQRGELRAEKTRSALDPVRAALAAASRVSRISIGDDLSQLAEALRNLQEARSQDDADESARFAGPLLPLADEGEDFKRLAKLTPEQRLKVFDKLIESLRTATSERESSRRNALGLLAGYLVTVAAGGAPSLSLAEANAQRWPEITAWAYVIGGIGERIVWTSSFDGLGRLVARELMRPLRLDESPMCDIAFDEGVLLADPELPDPLVHLRLKQSRIATVALLPGVNVSIPLAAQETARPEAPKGNLAPSALIPGFPNTVAALTAAADALWPYIRDRVAEYTDRRMKSGVTERHSEEPEPSQIRRKPDVQSDLPLRDSKK